ncbi:MAG: efflux RND transporter periplasmic adaptor subunit [Ignavibacteriales bacterium]|nr:efflux RND transporter periplasmic adaptor subunit [Ignavibacteriales bacterium]
MSKKSAKKKKKWIVYGALGALLVVVVGLTIASGGKEDIVSVQTEKVARRTITETVTTTGNIQPEFNVEIRPEVTGEVVQLNVEDGDQVKKGQLLLKIRPDTYLAQRERIMASLESQQATLEMREADLKAVRADFERVKELHDRDLVSDAEMEQAERSLKTAEASVESAKASIKQWRAQLTENSEELLKTSIIAPMDGTITQLNVELGERVLGSGFSQGQLLMTVGDLNSMEAIVEVDENDIVNVSVGDTARVTVDAFGDRVFRGLVRQLGNSAIATGVGTQQEVVNFEVKIDIIDLDPELRPGMSCGATIETETKKDVVAVPIQSVTAREKESEKGERGRKPQNGGEEKSSDRQKRFEEVVFLVENGKAKKVAVETGISDDYYIEITNGLDTGATVVSGSYGAISRELEDGAVVTVEDEFGEGKRGKRGGDE